MPPCNPIPCMALHILVTAYRKPQLATTKTPLNKRSPHHFIFLPFTNQKTQSSYRSSPRHAHAVSHHDKFILRTISCPIQYHTVPHHGELYVRLVQREIVVCFCLRQKHVLRLGQPCRSSHSPHSRFFLHGGVIPTSTPTTTTTTTTTTTIPARNTASLFEGSIMPNIIEPTLHPHI